MKSAKIFLILIVVLTLNVDFYSQKGNLQLAERFTSEMLNKMCGSTSVDANWIKNTDKFWYTYQTTEGKNWYIVDAVKKSKILIFDNEELSSKLAEHFNKAFNSKDLPLNDFRFLDKNKIFEFNVDSIKFTYNQESKVLTKKDKIKSESEKWATYSPDSTWISYSKNHNLYLMKANDPDSIEYQLSNDGERWYSYQTEEGDTNSSKKQKSIARWFDDSLKLFAVRIDKRKMGDLWVINSLTKRPELETYKYSLPGEENIEKYEVVVFDTKTKNSVKLKTDKWEDQAIGGIFFNKEGIFLSQKSDYLYFIRRDRTWSKVDFCKGNTLTGEVEVLISEESKPYFNSLYANAEIINNGKEIIWWSERNGWGQLYLYDGKGKLKNKITDGFFNVRYIQNIDTLNRIIYFEGVGLEKKINPYYSFYYKVNFDGTGFKRLTPEDATHSFTMTERFSYFVDNYSRVDLPTVSVLKDKNGNKILDLEKTDISRLVEVGWKKPEAFSVKSNDDATDLYGVMWKPADFDSTKKYPIITYVYPGPQVESFPTRFSNSRLTGMNTSLAQVGFIVVAFGNKGGSPMRSKYYHNYGYGNLRDYALIDNKYGIEQLAARHDFIDIERVGIYGHSGGGFMSTAALLTYPDFYKVAVSSAGNHDNNIYELWWSELHNGVKENKKSESRDSLKSSSSFDAQVKANTELVNNLKGHLLLVHSDMDNNVHPANTIRMVDALLKAGKRFDFMIIPGQRHTFGEHTAYFDRMMWSYFAEHLLGDYTKNIDFNLPKY